MVWIPLGAWIGAVALGLVLLGFCAYELTWKARRLQRDLGRLLAVQEQVTAIQAQVEAARARAAAASSQLAG